MSIFEIELQLLYFKNMINLKYFKSLKRDSVCALYLLTVIILIVCFWSFFIILSISDQEAVINVGEYKWIV